MIRNVAVAVVSLTVMLCRGEPVYGQTAQAALAQLKSAQTNALKALKLQVKTARTVFLLDLETFEDTVKGGGFSNASAASLFGDLTAMQTTTRDAWQAAFGAQASAARNALATLPGPLAGVYPRGFYPGDGGIADQFRVQVEVVVEKHEASLRKRLVKTTTLAEKTGVGLAFALSSPLIFKEFRWTEGASVLPTAAGPVIDVIVASSVLGVAGDGRVRVAGGSSLGDADTVTVTVNGTSNPAPAVAQVNDRRWTSAFNVSEGVFNVSVQQDGDGATRGTARIGVR